jgi:ribulose-5-phosphate 4-epimerase/fuculose-1-phosphate aldolase
MKLVLANRMLSSPELGVLDAFGHVSVRSRTNPNHFYISRYVAPNCDGADITRDRSGQQARQRSTERSIQERFLHGEIYKARPDVMAIVHSHTPNSLRLA